MTTDENLFVSILGFAATLVGFIALQHYFERAARKIGKRPQQLPSNVVKYSQVPKQGKKFTATTIPKGLLKEHNTKAGTWGLIRVSQGQLRYQINNVEPKLVQVLTPDTPTGVIEPQVKHEVAPLSEDVEFVVEFYRLPNTGPVDEKRE